MNRDECNGARYVPGSSSGHYESWFQRANHPTQAEALWIRYTIFVPEGRPDEAVGELWAIHFAPGRVTAVKEVHAGLACHFAARGLDVRIGEARLEDGRLEGSAALGDHALSWSLTYADGQDPLLLLPERLYGAPFPKAKALVGTPLAIYQGHLDVDGERVDVDGWIGSQNHNWGSKHTDEYAWGQVAGFDEASDAFLELSTARIHLGPIKTPWFTPLVLRLDGREHRFSGLVRSAAVNTGHYDVDTLQWRFSARAGDVRVEGSIVGQREDFVGLPYDNPPGGWKTCLNTKVAKCVLDVSIGATRRRLTSERAAFEILTDRRDHGLPVLDSRGLSPR